MTRLHNYLIEAKQVGSLYHIVGLEQLAYIVKNNKIQSQHTTMFVINIFMRQNMRERCEVSI